MGADVQFTDNTAQLMAALQKATPEALEIAGGMIESWAKGLAPQKWGAELRNSITHQVSDGTLAVGSKLEIAAYAELGTGKHYQPPPEWLENSVPKGTKVDAAGIDHWIYFDPLENKFKVGAPQEASPYLRPAIMDHVDDIQRVIEGELKKEQ